MGARRRLAARHRRRRAVETAFRERAEREIDRAEAPGRGALWIPFKELWEPDRVRVDGLWGMKRKSCLFRSSARTGSTAAHAHALGVAPGTAPSWPVADLRLYHLRMIDPEDRVARHERYRRLDPDDALQPMGYDYMLDDTTLELADIEPGRDYAR